MVIAARSVTGNTNNHLFPLGFEIGFPAHFFAGVEAILVMMAHIITSDELFTNMGVEIKHTPITNTMASMFEKSIHISDLLTRTDCITVHPMETQRNNFDVAFEVGDAIGECLFDTVLEAEHYLAATFPLCRVNIQSNGVTMDIYMEFSYKPYKIFFSNIEIIDEECMDD